MAKSIILRIVMSTYISKKNQFDFFIVYSTNRISFFQFFNLEWILLRLKSFTFCKISEAIQIFLQGLHSAILGK